ncbi:MAG: universal stress protein [Candidatus Omnitrophica bacterium]|nr:universal stress protein [Candidatus Omnitrophota bacterium]
MGLFLMIYPAMTNVKLEDLGKAAKSPKQLLVVLFFNFLIAPFFMLLLAKLFLSGNKDLYVGLVLYGLAPCIAMVIVFTFLSLGNNVLAIVLVAMNSIMQMILIPVYSKLLLGNISFDVLVVGESVVLYLGIPLIAGFITRRFGIQQFGEEGFKSFKTYLDSLSIIGLLFTLIVMFALKGDLILKEPMIIIHMAIPMIIFFWVMFVVVYLVGWKLGLNYEDSVAVAFNSTGRDFEIAIAIAITAFSPAVGLATVVGPLIEVPVMLVLVWAARNTRDMLFAVPAKVTLTIPEVVQRVSLFKKVLIAMDFSRHAENLLSCISDLKNVDTEEVILLHIIDPMRIAHWADPLSSIDDLAVKKMKEDVKKELEKIISKAERVQKTKHRVEVGVPYQEIVRVSQEEEATLMIMGSHGRSFIKGAILGSVTQNVLRHTTVPLLIVKYKFLEKEKRMECQPICAEMFRKVLWPTDFSSSALSVLSVMDDLKGAGAREVVIVHIQDIRKLTPHLANKTAEFNRVDTARLVEIKTRLESAGFRVKIVLREGVPFVEINKIAQEEDVSVIAISAKGKSAVEQVLIGSVTDEIVRQHIRPVLVIPAPEVRRK